MIMKIVYVNKPSGYTLPDYQVEDHVLLNYKSDIDIEVSSELVILAARALIAEGKMDKDQVEFFYEGESLGFCNKYGQLTNQPLGFCDYTDKFLDRILEVHWSKKDGKVK